MPCYLDSTSVSKTSTENRSEHTQPTKSEKNEDSGSDYGGEWSEDEWNDAQVKIPPPETPLLVLFCFVFLGGGGGGLIYSFRERCYILV